MLRSAVTFVGRRVSLGQGRYDESELRINGRGSLTSIAGG